MCIIECKQRAGKTNHQHHGPNEWVKQHNHHQHFIVKPRPSSKIVVTQQKCVGVCAARAGGGVNNIYTVAKKSYHAVGFPCNRMLKLSSSRGIRIDVPVLSVSWSFGDHSVIIQALRKRHIAVSYTHLTLPTKRIV